MARKLPDQDAMLGNKSTVLDRYMKSASEDVQASYNRNKVPTPEEIMQKSIESYNSIMGIKETAPAPAAAEAVEDVVRIKLADIVNHPKNPYRVHNHKRLEEMTDSIKESGVIEPIIVSSTYGDMDLQGKYICVAGHTRRLASARADLKIFLRLSAKCLPKKLISRLQTPTFSVKIHCHQKRRKHIG